MPKQNGTTILYEEIVIWTNISLPKFTISITMLENLDMGTVTDFSGFLSKFTPSYSKELWPWLTDSQLACGHSQLSLTHDNIPIISPCTMCPNKSTIFLLLLFKRPKDHKYLCRDDPSGISLNCCSPWFGIQLWFRSMYIHTMHLTFFFLFFII